MQTNRLALVALLAIVAAGCGESAERTLTRPDGAAPRLTTISSVNVCCPTGLYIGGSGSVFADVYDTNGQSIANPSVSWWSSNNAVAGVFGNGRYATVGANGVGTAILYATVNGVTGSTTVEVRAVPVVTTVQVTPSPLTVNTGATQTLTARAYDQYGNQMSGQTATWSTGNSGAATVSSTGLVTGVAPGTTTITATIAGKTASVSVTVANAIVLGDIYGPDMILTGGTYTWGVTSVSGGNGTYTYEWQIDWIDTPFEGYIPIATGATLSRHVTGCDGSFRIGLLVVSGNASAWKNYEVENFAPKDMCP